MKGRLPASLRGRLLVALLATSAATLGVAALVVLPPLQERLRDQTVETVQAGVINNLTALNDELAERRESRTPYGTYATDLFGLTEAMRDQSGARILVLHRTLQPADQESPPDFLYDSGLGTFTPQMLRAGIEAWAQPVARIEGDQVIVARELAGEFGSVVAVRELSQVSSLVAEVRNRFLVAAAVGLAVAALLAIGFSSTLLRRLGRLRAAALRITDEGPDAPTPHDDRRDEVGDLARALARMQEELRRQEAARRAFVSTASHELRTPLTMLQGTMELLEDDLRAGRLDTEDGLQQVGTARLGLNRLSALAGELLDLSRLDAAVPLRAEPVELGEIVRAVAAEFELRAERRDTPIEVALPATPCWGRGDPDAVARVARILLDNALRYGPEHTAVRMAARSALGRAVISVHDDGPGIPPEERERIFERFHRGSAAGSAGGFGLGLAIGRELARRMGGELDLEERGSGTCFELALRSASSPEDQRLTKTSARTGYGVEG